MEYTVIGRATYMTYWTVEAESAEEAMGIVNDDCPSPDGSFPEVLAWEATNATEAE